MLNIQVQQDREIQHILEVQEVRCIQLHQYLLLLQMSRCCQADRQLQLLQSSQCLQSNQLILRSHDYHKVPTVLEIRWLRSVR
jgi:hypothetical protein